MNFANLRAFYQVARNGNFTKASRELYMSQPALSRQVAALEEELGLQLFIRQGRRAILTDAGRRLLVYAEEMLDLSGKAEREMAEYRDLTAGALHLGASTTLASYFLPEMLAQFRQRHPQIDIDLRVGNSSRVRRMAAEGKVDIGLVAGEIQNDNVRLYQERVARDEVCLIINKNHRFWEYSDIRELQEETFLCREPGSDTQRSLEKLLEEMNITMHYKVVLGNTEAIKRGVISGMGVAFLSSLTFKYEEQLGLVVPVERISRERPFLLVYPKGSRLSPAALAFSALLKKSL